MDKKRMKLIERPEANEPKVEEDLEDRISNLPDVLLIHILSFLQTQDAIRTSVLSTRWKPLWASVPVLDFEDLDLWTKKIHDIHNNTLKSQFIDLVQKFFIQTEPSSIRKFCFHSDLSYNLSLIESWIVQAKERNVQELSFAINIHDLTDLEPSCSQIHPALMDDVPSFIGLCLSNSPLGPRRRQYGNTVSCSRKLSVGLLDEDTLALVLESWVHLLNEFNIEEIRLTFPGSTKVPQALLLWERLVALELIVDLESSDHHEEYLDFPNLAFPIHEVYLDFPKAEIYFPNLRFLHLDHVFSRNNSPVSNLINGGCPLLEELEIERCSDDELESLTITSRTLKALRVQFRRGECGLPTAEIRIAAPALQYLFLHDNVTTNYVFEDLDAVLEAKLHVSATSYSPFNQTTRSTALKLLQQMHNVECLTLTDATAIALQRTSCYDLMMFHHLTRLKIDDLHSAYRQDLVSWKLVLKFLKNSPKLEELVFWGTKFQTGEKYDLTSEQDFVTCLESQLKWIEFQGRFSRKEHELEIIGYLLRNSRVLRRMRIIRLGQVYGKELVYWEEFVEAILALPRLSTECEIQIE